MEYEKFTIIILSNAGRVGTGRGGSKKFKLIPAPPRGAGLKFIPITFVGQGKPKRDEARRGELSEAEYKTSCFQPTKAKPRSEYLIFGVCFAFLPSAYSYVFFMVSGLFYFVF